MHDTLQSFPPALQPAITAVTNALGDIFLPQRFDWNLSSAELGRAKAIFKSPTDPARVFCLHIKVEPKEGRPPLVEYMLADADDPRPNWATSERYGLLTLHTVH